MVQMARLFGADVIGLEANQAKLDFLERDLGIACIDSTDFEAAQLPEAWGKEADVVVDLLGRPPSLQWAQEALASNGRLVLLTTFPGVSFPVSPRGLVLGQGSILGSRYASRSEVQLAAELVAEERIRPIVSRIQDSESVEELHAELGQGTLVGRGAISWA
jgi:D-arabinose 1-dehydrogenase-like Zn-dependent alcohol dehydrogenase